MTHVNTREAYKGLEEFVAGKYLRRDRKSVV